MENFIECDNVQQANQVNLDVYTFVGLKGETYVFKIRQRK